MAVRGSTLATLQTRIRDLVPGSSTTGAFTDSALAKALNRAREFAYTQFLWPHLRKKIELNFTGGKAALPSDYFSYADLRDTNNTVWEKLDPISFEDPVMFNSNAWTIEEDSEIVRTITAANLVSNVVTITTSEAHTYQVGDSITQAGVASATFNATITIASTPTTTTYTYALIAPDEASAGGTATRVAADKIFVKPETTTRLFFRYYKTLPDLVNATDQSEFFPYQEEGLVRGAIDFLSLRDRDSDWLREWETNMMEHMTPVYQRGADDEDDQDMLRVDYDRRPLFLTRRSVKRIST